VPPKEHDGTTFVSTPTPTLSARMHNVRDGRTDKQTNSSIMTIADHTACNNNTVS